MFEKAREGLANFLTGNVLERLKETVTLLDIRLEDAEWNKLDRIVSDTDMNLQDLSDVRRKSYIYWLKYPLVKQSVRLLTEFVFADGVTEPKSKDETVQLAINEIWNNRQNQRELFGYQAQIEKSNELQINGEIFFVLFQGTVTKKMEIGTIEPGEIREIITDPQNKKRVLYYKREFNEKTFNYSQGRFEEGKQPKTLYYKDWENTDDVPKDIKPEQIGEGVIYHVKINSIRSKRGIPEPYVILDWAKSHKRMNEDLATWTKALSTFAWKKKLKKGGKAIMDALKATYQAKKDRSNPSSATAATIIENEYVENTPMDFKTGSADWEKNIRAMVLSVAAGYGFGEQYYGNPSTANLAIGEKMELPLLKKISGWQMLWVQVYKDIIIYGLKDRTIIKEAEDDEMDYSIDIDFPPIVVLDILRYIQALQVSRQMGIISKDEAARKGLTVLGVNNIDEVLEQAKLEPPDIPAALPSGFGQNKDEENDAVMNTLAALEKKVKEALEND